MPTPVQLAAETYIKVFSERDPAKRKALIEACWAEDGRLVTASRVIRGRDGIEKMAAAFLADPQWKHIRMLSVIDAEGTTFRFRGLAERHDGTGVEAFDAGEIGPDGKIVTIYTFAGPLQDA